MNWTIWLIIVPALLLADAHRTDFSLCSLAEYPVPRRLLDTDFGGRLLVATANGRDRARRLADRARHSPRDAAITVAALLMLLTATPGDAR